MGGLRWGKISVVLKERIKMKEGKKNGKNEERIKCRKEGERSKK